MLYFINWPNFNAWLPILLEIYDNMCIAIVWYPVCDVKKIEIYLSFLIKLFSYIHNTSKQKFKKEKCF